MTKKSLACIAFGSLLFSGIDASASQIIRNSLSSDPILLQEEIRSEFKQDQSEIIQKSFRIEEAVDQTIINERDSAAEMIIKAEAMNETNRNEISVSSATEDERNVQNLDDTQPSAQKKTLRERAWGACHRASLSLNLVYNRLKNSVAKAVIEIIIIVVDGLEAFLAPQENK